MVNKASCTRATTRKFCSTALSAAIATVLYGASPVYGQNQGDSIEEISVTGSRIRNTSGFVTPVPVTSMTTDELADFEPGNTISQQLDALPQFFETRTLQDTGSPSNSNRSASGLNLRNLGPNRTLVLLDGSRFAPTEKQGTVNVDILPTALVRSVDIVTGGASAAYGADAVGGVVNFVLDREFEGLTVKVGTGMHERNNGGEQWNLEVAGGRSFLNDRLHIIGSAQQRLQDQLDGTATVDSFQRWGHVTCPQWQADRTGPRRCTYPDVVSTLSSPTGLIEAPGTPIDRKKFNMDGTEIVDFIEGDVVALPGTSGTTNSMSGGPEADLAYEAFNTSPSTSEAIARSFFFGAQFDVSDQLVINFDALSGRTEANAVGTSIREGDAVYELAGNWRASLAVDNAYLPDNVRQAMVDAGLDEIPLHKLGTFPERGSEGFNQISRNVTTQEQYGVGFTYDFADLDWRLQGRWQTGDVWRSRQSYNRIAVDRMYLAMDAVRDPDSGAIVCRVQLPQYSPTPEQLRASPVIQGLDSSVPLDPWVPTGEDGNTKPLESPIGLDNTVQDCVPYNVMGAGNISPEALKYITRDKFGTGTVKQDFAELVLTGDLFELPAGPVDFAAGLTWRDQEFTDKPTAGAGVGVGGKIVTNEDLGPALNDPALGIRGISPGYSGGSPNLSQFITIPNIAGAQSVWEWYAEVNMPILQTTVGNWNQSLVANLAFRQSDYERSGKSDSWKVGLDYQFSDDLRFRYTTSQDVREPTFTELFDARGGGATVRDPQFDDASFQISIFRGGNLNLTPETARTDTFGIVWQPSFSILDGLQVSLDYWDTEVEDQVGELSVQRYVDECEDNGLLCDQVQRDPTTNFITKVYRQYVNLAQATAAGVDFEISYRTEPDFFSSEFETFSIRWLASELRERSDTPLGGTPFDIAGQLESPDFTGVLTANYSIGAWSVQLQNRFVDTTTYNSSWIEGIDVDDNSVDSMSWWNGRISYQSEMNNGASWTVGLNVQNLLDEDQPVVPGFSTRGGSQQFSGQFDRFGRRYNLNLNLTF